MEKLEERKKRFARVRKFSSDYFDYRLYLGHSIEGCHVSAASIICAAVLECTAHILKKKKG